MAADAVLLTGPVRISAAHSLGRWHLINETTNIGAGTLRSEQQWRLSSAANCNDLLASNPGSLGTSNTYLCASLAAEDWHLRQLAFAGDLSAETAVHSGGGGAAAPELAIPLFYIGGIAVFAHRDGA
jgi:hypothetical protein